MQVVKWKKSALFSRFPWHKFWIWFRHHTPQSFVQVYIMDPVLNWEFVSITLDGNEKSSGAPTYLGVFTFFHSLAFLPRLFILFPSLFCFHFLNLAVKSLQFFVIFFKRCARWVVFFFSLQRCFGESRENFSSEIINYRRYMKLKRGSAPRWFHFTSTPTEVQFSLNLCIFGEVFAYTNIWCLFFWGERQWQREK